MLTVTNRDYFFLTRDEYGALGAKAPALDFLLEPVSRNTAPAIGWINRGQSPILPTQVLGLQASLLCDARQHAGADFLPVMKGEHEIRPSWPARVSCESRIVA